MFVTPSPGWRTLATPRPSSGPPSCTTHTSPGAVAWNAVRRFSARTRMTTAPTIPIRPTPATSDRGRSGSRGSRLLGDVNRRTDRNLVIQVDDVGDPHADAPVRRRGADRADVVGPVDAGPGEDAHPPRLERVVRRAARDDLTGERPGPRAVRHVPRRVDLLVLDRVTPGRGLEPGHADGDAVALAELQPLEQAQLEVRAVDGEDGVVDPGEVRERDPRTHPHEPRVDLARGGRIVDLRVDRGAGRVDRERPAVVRLLAEDVTHGDLDRRVLRRLADARGHARDEVADRRAR